MSSLIRSLTRMVKGLETNMKGHAWEAHVRRELEGSPAGYLNKILLGERIQYEGDLSLLEEIIAKRAPPTYGHPLYIPDFILREDGHMIGGDAKATSKKKVLERRTLQKVSTPERLVELLSLIPSHWEVSEEEKEHLKEKLSNLTSNRMLIFHPVEYTPRREEHTTREGTYIFYPAGSLTGALTESYSWLMREMPPAPHTPAYQQLEWRIILGMGYLLGVEFQPVLGNEKEKRTFLRQIGAQIEYIRGEDSPQGAYARFLTYLLKGGPGHDVHQAILAAGPAELERILTREDHTPRWE